ncbi:MAG: ATP-binding protein [Elusimicrobiota bacterium]
MTVETRDIPILAVDDEPGDCDLNKAILEAAGFRVATAQTAREAKALLAERSFAVLLVDLRLPDANGLELLKIARANDPHTVAVVITAFSSLEDAIASLQAGAYDFLLKPCPADRLEATVRRAAEKYALSRALTQRTRQLEAVNEHLDTRVREATEEIFELNERLKRKNEELSDTNKSLTHFLEDVAHELRNPLGVVQGYATLLLKSPIGDWDPDELNRGLRNMAANSEHIRALVEELLDASRLARRKLVLDPERFAAAEAVSDAVDSLQLQAKKRDVRLEAELPQDLGLPVCADRKRLRQVLYNLISNAIKFTPPGGRVAVGLLPDGRFTRFYVSDTGKGIPEEDLERIFDRFYQSSGAPSRAKGLGLGLSIVDGLVKLHGGLIWAESEPDQGACFHFVLPRHPDDMKPDAEEKRRLAEALASPN